jgi:site-specific recombinase XerD
MKRKAILIFTDETCDINGRIQAELPLMLDAERKVIHPASDWFRYQAVMLNYPPTTLRLYADILRSFWNYLTERDFDWTEVDDDILMNWRNHQEIEIGVKKRTINQRLTTVFQFYWWAQSRGYVCDMVADPNRSRDSEPPRISVAIKPTISKARIHPQFTIGSALLYKTTREPNLHTPTAEEATRLHATLATLYGASVAERNTLMLSWAEEAGLRRKEFAALTVGQIPTWHEIDQLIEDDLSKDIELVVTKGGHHRIVEIVPDILLRTRNYIEEDRAKIVRRFERKYGEAYQTPDVIFLSEKTGKALNLRAISNLIRPAFREANVPGSGHRMRARYLTNLVQFYYDEALKGKSISFDIVLLKAAEAAGHAHPESLRPYLNLIRKRALTAKPTERRRHLEQRILSVERTLDSKLRLLETTALMEDLAKAVRSGKKSTIKSAWGRLEASMSAILTSSPTSRTKLRKVA